jgi:hypothetical protein
MSTGRHGGRDALAKDGFADTLKTMTVLIGFSFRDLTVLGADSRGVSHENPDDVADDMQKIYKTGFGLMAGAGRSDVIEAVTSKFANHAPTSNREATEVIRAEIDKLGLAPDDPAILKTCWLASYATNTAQGPQAQLALVSRDIGYDFGLWKHDDFLIIKPNGMDDEIGRNLEAEARRRFDQRLRSAPPEQRLGLCVLMISGLVKTVSRYNDTVSAHFSVGYHDATQSLVRVSNVCQEPDGIEWH